MHILVLGTFLAGFNNFINSKSCSLCTKPLNTTLTTPSEIWVNFYILNMMHGRKDSFWRLWPLS
jgi:hypothetical protein